TRPRVAPSRKRPVRRRRAGRCGWGWRGCDRGQGRSKLSGNLAACSARAAGCLRAAEADSQSASQEEGCLMLELRPYQRDSIDALYKYWATEGSGNGLIVLPTGAGKALVIAKIIEELLADYPD